MNIVFYRWKTHNFFSDENVDGKVTKIYDTHLIHSSEIIGFCSRETFRHRLGHL